MRIISGKYKGRPLSSWKKELPVRPMTDKVKESLFNVLSPYWYKGCKVLDLFSGTGSLALESLSRGAKVVHAIEKHPLCIQLIQKNLKKLNLLPDSLILHKKNVFSVLKKAQNSPSLKNSLLKNPNPKKILPVFDLVLIDPPFRLKTSHLIMNLLSNSFLVDKKSLIVIETDNKEELASRYLFFELFSKKDFKDKRLCFYKKP